jgi:hypothetical protein
MAASGAVACQRDGLVADRPVHSRGVARGWPCWRRWSPPRLAGEVAAARRPRRRPGPAGPLRRWPRAVAAGSGGGVVSGCSGRCRPSPARRAGVAIGAAGPGHSTPAGGMPTGLSTRHRYGQGVSRMLAAGPSRWGCCRARGQATHRPGLRCWQYGHTRRPTASCRHPAASAPDRMSASPTAARSSCRQMQAGISHQAIGRRSWSPRTARSVIATGPGSGSARARSCASLKSAPGFCTPGNMPSPGPGPRHCQSNVLACLGTAFAVTLASPNNPPRPPGVLAGTGGMRECQAPGG